MEYNCVYRPLGIKKIVNCSIIWNIIVSIGHWRLNV